MGAYTVLVAPDFATKRYGIAQHGNFLRVISWCCDDVLIEEADDDNDDDSDMFCPGCEQRFSAIPSDDSYWIPAIYSTVNTDVIARWASAWVGQEVEVTRGYSTSL